LKQRSDGWFCRAHDLVLGRPVLVKMFKSTVDEAAARTFAVQAKSLVGMRHDHLVGLYDGGVADGHPYLVLEPVDGFDLLDATHERALSASDTATLGAGLAEVLARMHANGVVHGDLTLESVLIDANGQRRLVGLGFGHTQESTAPADVHALGLVLLQCLSGQNAARPDGTTVWPLARVLTAMTRRDAARRPSAAVCARRLNQVAATLETGRRLPTVASVRRGRATSLAAVGGLVTVGVIAFASVSSPHQAVPPVAAAPAPTMSSQLPIPDSTTTATAGHPVSYPPPTTRRSSPGRSAPPTTSGLPTTDTQTSTVSADPTSVAPTTTENVPPGLAKKPGGQPPGLFKKWFDLDW
jgi:serine/threonine protein kinase